MKIKKTIPFFLIIVMSFVLSHCSTYTVKRDISKNGELTKTPRWYVKYEREDKKWIYETAASVSPDLELSVKKSVLLAKAKLADRINGEMNNRTTIIKNEDGLNEAMITKAKAKDKVVNIISDTVVRNYIVEKVDIYYTHNKSYRAYVKIKVSKKNVKAVVSEIKSNKRLAAIEKKSESKIKKTIRDAIKFR